MARPAPVTPHSLAGNISPLQEALSPVAVTSVSWKSSVVQVVTESGDRDRQTCDISEGWIESREPGCLANTFSRSSTWNAPLEGVSA